MDSGEPYEVRQSQHEQLEVAEVLHTFEADELFPDQEVSVLP